MYLIKSCPSCGKKIRFPIDKGKIRVTCECGSPFLADPDDPSLYNDSAFDLQGTAGEKSGGQSCYKLLSKLKEDYKNLQVKDIFSRIINRLFDYKYKIQNFKILPATEQKKIILVLFIISLILGAIIFLVIKSAGNAEMDEMTI
jgi:hypothetical protein